MDLRVEVFVLTGSVDEELLFQKLATRPRAGRGSLRKLLETHSILDAGVQAIGIPCTLAQNIFCELVRPELLREKKAGFHELRDTLDVLVDGFRNYVGDRTAERHELVVFVFSKKLFDEVNIDRGSIFIFFAFRTGVDLKQVVERIVTGRIIKEWHLVLLFCDVLDVWVLADSEERLHNHSGIGQRRVLSYHVHDRLLVRQDVVADSEFLLIWDLAEFIVEEIAVLKHALNYKPVKKYKRLLRVKLLVVNLLVVLVR